MTWVEWLFALPFVVSFLLAANRIASALDRIADALAPVQHPRSDWYGGGLKDIAKAIRETRG
jgi:hypothetical protein